MFTCCNYNCIACSICELNEVYHEGDFSPQYAWLWIMVINNISQIVSSCGFCVLCLADCLNALDRRLNLRNVETGARPTRLFWADADVSCCR